MNLNLLFSAAAVALVAFVYAVILTEPKMILNGLFNYLDNQIGDHGKRPAAWLFNPLIGCFRCVAGQFAFWYFIIKYPYDPFIHIFYVSFTIFTVIAINKLYNYIKQ